MKNIITNLTAVMCCFLFLLSCSNPTSNCKDILANRIRSASGGYLELSDFKKTDAVEEQLSGVASYHISYKLTIKSTKDGWWYDGQDNELYGFTPWPQECMEVGSGIWAGTQCHHLEAHAGSTYTYTGKMTLEKHEGGWKEYNPF